jgi:hypothetical protein
MNRKSLGAGFYRTAAYKNLELVETVEGLGS